MNIRAFIALELSTESIFELSRIKSILKDTDADIKWSGSDTMHITLGFLGDIPESGVSEITGIIEDIAIGMKPFDVTLEGVGVFPGWRHPKVLWVGIGKGNDTVKCLEEKVRAAVGSKKEDRFVPHITIGRVRSSPNPRALRKAIDSIDVTPVLIRVSRIAFFRSQLTPDGPVHTILGYGGFKDTSSTISI